MNSSLTCTCLWIFWMVRCPDVSVHGTNLNQCRWNSNETRNCWTSMYACWPPSVPRFEGCQLLIRLLGRIHRRTKLPIKLSIYLSNGRSNSNGTYNCRSNSNDTYNCRSNSNGTYYCQSNSSWNVQLLIEYLWKVAPDAHISFEPAEMNVM